MEKMKRSNPLGMHNVYDLSFIFPEGDNIWIMLLEFYFEKCFF